MEKKNTGTRMVSARDPKMSIDDMIFERPSTSQLGIKKMTKKDPSFKGATESLPHIRCYSCGKVIGHLHDIYNEMLSKNMNPADIFEKLGISRVCCRTRIANPAVIAMAEYIEKSDVMYDEVQKELEKVVIEEAEDIVLKAKREQEEANKSKVSKLKMKIANIKSKQEEKKEEQQKQKSTPKRVSVFTSA